jgi:hypothetical protein
VPEVWKTLTKRPIDHDYLPPIQGGSFFGRVPGVKTPG